MNVETTAKFDRDFRRLPKEMQDRVRATIHRMMTDPSHPSLNLKKMGGADVWEIRVTEGYRITLEVEGDLWILRRVGTHDILRAP